jgi:hypothetical protein
MINNVENLNHIYNEIHDEVLRSTTKHGDNVLLPNLDPILIHRGALRMAENYEIPTAGRAGFLTDNATKNGQLTHAHIVVEELAEVIDTMNDTEKMRIELIQLACTVVKWINAIDWKNSNIYNAK